MEEYKLNLSIGLQLRTLLQKRGFKVVMTRTNSKVALSCIDRAKVANKAKADAYIRIHANGSDNSSISGALTICTTRNSPYISSMYRKNKALSEAVLNAYVAAYRMQKRIRLGNRLYDRKQLEQSSDNDYRNGIYEQSLRRPPYATEFLSEKKWYGELQMELRIT
ncbi:N-acetylmuramoyl-L-alanine amidase [Blautia wexlerae]|nr:N-acetylmuramoyl-L-alanine amidase [Blautia wexlerae]